VVRNLVGGGFCGPVYPINPAATEIQSIAAYASLDDTPAPVDIAVIALPAEKVVHAAEECGRKGAALVVLSGVRLHLATPRQVELAAIDMESMLASARGTKLTGYVVQRMAATGVEMLVGVVNDSRFGRDRQLVSGIL
jgi:acyl-CoA synthetase (NDP forming)